MTTKSLDQLLDDATASTNHYATHLGEVDESNNVYSTEDIVNEQNLPLVKKGTRITPEIAQRILKHKLMKPIELQVQLEKSVEKELLLERFECLLEKYPDLKQLYLASEYQKPFSQLVRAYILSPLLIQKLTVFSQQLPDEFEKTLFCTLLATIFAFEAKLNKEQIISTYIAGLSHDLGYLHISPDIFQQNKNLSAAEWRAIHSHVITSYMFILNIGRDYKDVAIAVLEHHELCDGSGYPMGKKAEKLGIIGQLIGMADSLQAIRINQFEKVGRNLHDTIPFLQMNPAIHSEPVYRAAISAIKKMPNTTTSVNPFQNTDELTQHLITRSENLGSASLIIGLLLHLSNDLDLRKAGKEMLHIITPFDKMVRQSGLVEDHIMKWLEHVKNSSDYNPLNELCELELMQNELYWQLKKARNSFINFLEQEPNAGSEETIQHLNKIAAEIENFL